MDLATAQPVPHESSELLIAYIERTITDPRAGLFGPGSITWRVNRESALFLGAGRAALMQLAHPWVATALEQHSTLMARPIARFHSTFRIVFTMVFGSLAQATAAARHVYSLHTYVQGSMAEDVARWPRGSHYQANEIAALRWVYATLIESAVLAYNSVLPPLTSRELEAYYAENKRLAALFGLPASSMPADWESFQIYCREMEQSGDLGVSNAARAMAHNLLAGAGSWIKPPQWYRALTMDWLARRFRTEFGLRFGAEEEHAAFHARQALPRWYGRLPDAVRFVGPWREAQARLLGRKPGLLARLGNKFWIGEASMPFS